MSTRSGEAIKGLSQGTNPVAQPTVSVIIATYNRHEILGATLEMSISQDYENLEIIVIDQTPTPFTMPEHLNSSSSRAFFYEWHPHPNLAAARNRGFRHSSGDIIIFLDDDVEIAPDYVAGIVATYSGFDVGGVCGLLVSPGTCDYDAAMEHLTGLLGLDEPFRRGGTLAVRSMIGANMSFRREVIVKAGLFDEAFGGSGYGEDTEFSIRVRRLGYRLLLNPVIRGVHVARTTGGCSVRDPALQNRVRRERLVLQLYLLLKHFGWRPLHTLRAYYGAWRSHALNKATLRLGPASLIARHLEILSATSRALAYLFGIRRALL